MKRLLVLLLALTLFSVYNQVCIAQDSRENGDSSLVICVEADGSGDYTSLEEAIGAAEHGAIIKLGPGTYELARPLRIRKPLRLVGSGMDETEIISEGEEFVVQFYGRGPFNVEDIHFRHKGLLEADVVVVRGGEANFRSCRFSGAVQQEGTFYRAGLLLRKSTTGLVEGCVAEWNDRIGIRLDDGSDAFLISNTCTGNEYYGIRVSGSAGGTLRENECTWNGRHGIYVDAAAHPLLESNTCSDNDQCGIAFGDTAEGEARQNECASNGSDGIRVFQTAKPILEGNKCIYNWGHGIRYYDNSAGIARGNECSHNANNGILVQTEATPLLERNTCTGNEKSCGIYYAESAGGIARENECFENGAYGIFVASTARPQLVDNNCQDNPIDILDLSSGLPNVETAFMDFWNTDELLYLQYARAADAKDNEERDTAYREVVYLNGVLASKAANIVESLQEVGFKLLADTIQSSLDVFTQSPYTSHAELWIRGENKLGNEQFAERNEALGVLFDAILNAEEELVSLYPAFQVSSWGH